MCVYASCCGCGCQGCLPAPMPPLPLSPLVHVPLVLGSPTQVWKCCLILRTALEPNHQAPWHVLQHSPVASTTLACTPAGEAARAGPARVPAAGHWPGPDWSPPASPQRHPRTHVSAGNPTACNGSRGRPFQVAWQHTHSHASAWPTACNGLRGRPFQGV